MTFLTKICECINVMCLNSFTSEIRFMPCFVCYSIVQTMETKRNLLLSVQSINSNENDRKTSFVVEIYVTKVIQDHTKHFVHDR